ncbi:MAG: di-trans,poly-cis-decaprenylcistransferase [Betaproteobacteria bacterium]|nr:di-trans,poly-cis-decaprenylcistransferase [Betaproteobacteria bacterium]
MKRFISSTRAVPDVGAMPKHIAIIMDGNGRWARRRFLPRVAGHRRGVEAVREMIRACIRRGIPYVTLFAFSSENWRRPVEEVSFLMQLFVRALQEEVARLHENGIRFRVIGDLSRFDRTLVDLIEQAEALTASNERLTLTIAANYGGRWDILQAVRRLVEAHPEASGNFREEDLEPYLALNHAPEPDLFIRTGGEQRISNFLLWQLAYSEFYFVDTLWPEFDEAALDLAIKSYQRRERRFGRTSEQLKGEDPRRASLVSEPSEPVGAARHDA